MIKPLFSAGKELERTLSNPADSSTQVLFVNAASDFQVGDRAFIAEADGSELECLGAVEAVGDDSIVVQFSLAAAKSTSATVWRGADVFQWQTTTARPRARSFDEGLVVERSIGGGVWSVRVSDPVREDRLQFIDLSWSHFEAFRTWLAGAARGGLDDFTWVDEARRVARVRLLDSALEEVETAPGVLNLTLDLAVLEEGGCA